MLSIQLHFSVLLLSLIRQEGFVAKCQDIGLGNPPTLREGKEVCPPHFFYFCTSTLANFEIPLQDSSIHTVLSQLYSVAQETLKLDIPRK